MKYLIILIIMSLILTGCLWLLYKWYKQEQDEKDARILQLEKRLESHRHFEKQVYCALVETISDNYDELNDEIKLIKRELKKK